MILKKTTNPYNLVIVFILLEVKLGHNRLLVGVLAVDMVDQVSRLHIYTFKTEISHLSH